MHDYPVVVAKFARQMLAGLLLAGEVVAQSAQAPATLRPIEYGYPDQSIFVATIDTTGHVDSPMNRLAAALMERVGLPMNAVAYPASRLFSNLQNGTTDFAILVRATSLEACCLFSRWPVYGTDLNVYSIGDKPPVRSRADLAGSHVITIRGYSYGGLLAFINDPVQRVSNEVASTHKAAFEMLRAGRADYLLDYASAAGTILADNPIPQLNAQRLDRMDIFLVLSRSYPNADRLMLRLEEIVRTLDVPGLIKGVGASRTPATP